MIYNTSYQQIATVQAANGVRGVDLHEFSSRHRATRGSSASRRSLPGAEDQPLMDAVVQEIDVKTGLVLFEWHALDHIPITASSSRPTRPDWSTTPTT